MLAYSARFFDDPMQLCRCVWVRELRFNVDGYRDIRDCPATKPRKGKTMFDPFVQSQWQQLCAHLGTCAVGIARDANEEADFVRESFSFANEPAPERYRDLLERKADAANLAVKWQSTRDADVAHDDALIDEACRESFPASDPPTFSQAHA